MTKDLPDNTKEVTLKTTAGFAGIEELARRLGSVVPFDSRGKVTYADGFEDALLKWDKDYVSPGLVPRLSQTYAIEGHQSVKLECGADTLATSIIGRSFSLISEGRIGIELWVQGHFHAGGLLTLAVSFYDGTNRSDAYWDYDGAAGTLQIRWLGGSYVAATGIYMAPDCFYFLPIKLVLDIDTDKFVRLVVASQEVDLSAYSMDLIGATTDKYIYIALALAGADAGAQKAYIDNLIITRDEP